MAEWALFLPDKLAPFVPGRSRLVGIIGPTDQTTGHMKDGKVHMAFSQMISNGLIVELPDAQLQIQVPSQGFEQINCGPYRNFHEIRKEVERYTEQSCALMDVVDQGP